MKTPTIEQLDGVLPANIDYKDQVILQVTKSQQSVILYTCHITGNATRCYLPISIGRKYTQGIYVL